MNVVKNYPIVSVGGSAGDLDAYIPRCLYSSMPIFLDAYIRLLKHLPHDMGVAIVIVNHLRSVATLLHEILPHSTRRIRRLCQL